MKKTLIHAGQIDARQDFADLPDLLVTSLVLCGQFPGKFCPLAIDESGAESPFCLQLVRHFADGNHQLDLLLGQLLLLITHPFLPGHHATKDQHHQ